MQYSELPAGWPPSAAGAKAPGAWEAAAEEETTQGAPAAAPVLRIWMKVPAAKRAGKPAGAALKSVDGAGDGAAGAGGWSPLLILPSGSVPAAASPPPPVPPPPAFPAPFLLDAEAPRKILGAAGAGGAPAAGCGVPGGDGGGRAGRCGGWSGAAPAVWGRLENGSRKRRLLTMNEGKGDGLRAKGLPRNSDFPPSFQTKFAWPRPRGAPLPPRRLIGPRCPPRRPTGRRLPAPLPFHWPTASRCGRDLHIARRLAAGARLGDSPCEEPGSRFARSLTVTAAAAPAATCPPEGPPRRGAGGREGSRPGHAPRRRSAPRRGRTGPTGLPRGRRRGSPVCSPGKALTRPACGTPAAPERLEGAWGAGLAPPLPGASGVT